MHDTQTNKQEEYFNKLRKEYEQRITHELTIGDRYVPLRHTQQEYSRIFPASHKKVIL